MRPLPDDFEPFDPEDGPDRPFAPRVIKTPPARFDATPLSEIMKMEFEPIRWAVKGYVPEGLSILAGRQKLGKTWLALDWSIAVGTGGAAMGKIPVDAGDVLYLDLENGHRRVKRRIETLFPYEQNRPDLSRIQIVTKSPALDKGFIEAAEAWRVSVPKPTLLVIDVLQRIKPAGNKNQNAYESDYAIFQELQSWAMETGVAVVALTHTKKGGADDPLEAITGSNGLSAVADTSLILDRNSEGVTLYVRGRDVEEQDTAIQNVGGQWIIQGDAEAVRRSSERNKILAALEDAGEPLAPKDIVAATGMKEKNVSFLLNRMANAGEVERPSRGLYAPARNARNARNEPDPLEEADDVS